MTYTCDLGYAMNPKDVSSTTSQLSYKENGFKPVRLSLAIPWFATSLNLKILNGPRCRLDALKRFPDSSGFLSMLESSTLVRQDSQPVARLLNAHYYLLCVKLREI